MMTDDWRKCYAGGWQGLIVPEAFAHPAKFSRALIRRIYEHCFEEGWLQAGSTIVDPFGGVGMGALHALQHGLNWVGVELEEKFCLLSQQNLDLWNERYSRLPGWGTARIVQGDSRRLGEVLAGADLCLSSPPYANSDVACAGGDMGGTFKKGGAGGHSHQENGYGPSPRNLGNLPTGDIFISSPPFGDSQKAQDVDFFCKVQRKHRPNSGGTYPSSRGVYAPSVGNLGKMADCASSPPFEQRNQSVDTEFVAKLERDLCNGSRMQGGGIGDYGATTGQLGRETGDTFWSASRTILEQVYQVLVPGGHAVFVLKAFVRNKKIVDFPAQWRELCEAVGFTTLHLHRAWLVEERGGAVDVGGRVGGEAGCSQKFL